MGYDKINSKITDILNRINVDDILVSRGATDHLDHASPKFAVGGKLGLDCTGDEIDELGITLLEDSELLSKMKNISRSFRENLFIISHHYEFPKKYLVITCFPRIMKTC